MITTYTCMYNIPQYMAGGVGARDAIWYGTCW